MRLAEELVATAAQVWVGAGENSTIEGSLICSFGIYCWTFMHGDVSVLFGASLPVLV